MTKKLPMCFRSQCVPLPCCNCSSECISRVYHFIGIASSYIIVASNFIDASRLGSRASCTLGDTLFIEREQSIDTAPIAFPHNTLPCKQDMVTLWLVLMGQRSQQTRYIHPMVGGCWASVVDSGPIITHYRVDPVLVECWVRVADDGPTSNHHWVDVSCY